MKLYITLLIIIAFSMGFLSGVVLLPEPQTQHDEYNSCDDGPDLGFPDTQRTA